MKAAWLAVAVVLVPATCSLAQDGVPRAWQQRVPTDINLAVPLVTLSAVNPFATRVDTAPQLLGSTPPKKLDVAGSAVVAAYVDGKGNCLGGVPLELPFPGLTASILEEMKNVRFDPATREGADVGSWVVLAVDFAGRVKSSTVNAPSFELPDPENPPEPSLPPRVSPSGRLLRAPYVSQELLTTFASPRRLKIKVAAQDADIPIRALVHVTESGRCDRFVPLNIELGLHRWLSAYLATWRLDPARLDGQPHDAWVVYSARAQLELSSLTSTGVRVLRDRDYAPPPVAD